MNRIAKETEKQLHELLKSCPPPEPDTERRKTYLARLTAAAEEMDYLRQESFFQRILSTGASFSGWTWAAHIVLLLLFYTSAFSEDHSLLTAISLGLAPGLVLLLLYELSKTFGNHMWEMESVCRYNLPQLFFLRLTLLGSMDFVVLTLCLVVFRMTGGLLWQFAVYTLLPFFLLSSFCLFLLRRLGSRCHPAGLVAAVLLAEFLWIPFAEIFQRIQRTLGDRILNNCVCTATLAALIFFLGNAVFLCRKKHYDPADSMQPEY